MIEFYRSKFKRQGVFKINLKTKEDFKEYYFDHYNESMKRYYKQKKYIVFKEGTRFAICMDEFRLKDIKNRIKLSTFRNKNSEYKKLSKTFDEVRYLYMIYQILSED